MGYLSRVSARSVAARCAWFSGREGLDLGRRATPRPSRPNAGVHASNAREKSRSWSHPISYIPWTMGIVESNLANQEIGFAWRFGAMTAPHSEAAPRAAPRATVLLHLPRFLGHFVLYIKGLNVAKTNSGSSGGPQVPLPPLFFCITFDLGAFVDAVVPSKFA